MGIRKQMDLASEVVPGFLFDCKVLSVADQAFQAGSIKKKES
jgi:hypothetical protein